MNTAATLTEQLNWNQQGLVPAIAQDWRTGEVLMLAWMNREALQLTIAEGRAVYWSRSRGALWRKGQESGNVQQLKELVKTLKIQRFLQLICLLAKPFLKLLLFFH